MTDPIITEEMKALFAAEQTSCDPVRKGIIEFALHDYPDVVRNAMQGCKEAGLAHSEMTQAYIESVALSLHCMGTAQPGSERIVAKIMGMMLERAFLDITGRNSDA